MRTARKLMDRLCAKGWADRYVGPRRRHRGHIYYTATASLEDAVETEWEHLLGVRLRGHPEALEALRRAVSGWMAERPPTYPSLADSAGTEAEMVHERPDEPPPKR